MTQKEAEDRVSEFYKGNVKLISEYKNRRTKIKLQCIICNNVWESSPQNCIYASKIRNGRCQYCYKKECEKKNYTLYCANCGKKIARTECEVQKNKSGFFYCSKECGNKHKNKIRYSNKNKIDEYKNYRLKAFHIYEHKCALCEWDEDERVLEVHHINENRKDNSIENLIILCPICHKYLSLHIYSLHKLENGEWTFGEAKPFKFVSAKKVIRISENGELKEYDSITNAAKDIKRTKSSLSTALRNNTKCAGYKWKYKN